MADVQVSVCNPALRTPLSLIIDDSCAVVNLAYFWMKERHEWKARHRPGEPPDAWEGDAARLDSLPRAIPHEFARRWAEWCAEEGIRGKFSFIPCPAGLGRIDRGIRGFPRSEFDEWLRVAREAIAPSFDLTPEMLTHTHVVDPASLDSDEWRPTEEWEQVEWVDPPAEPLEEYVAAGMRVLKEVGLPAAGVTSPGAYAKKKEPAHARAVLEAAKRVNSDPRPFYFLHMEMEKLPGVPIHHADVEKAEAVASVVGCAGDWFGGWTGYDAGDADRFITEDLCGGRLPAVLEAERPCVLVGHWPGFYFGGEETGFGVLREVKRRLDAYDPGGERTIWMKNSEIGRYWMARELSEIAATADGARVTTRFPAEGFTLRIGGGAARRVRVAEAAPSPQRRVRVEGRDLREVRSRRELRSGAFLVEGGDTFAAFDLGEGETRILIDR